MNLWQQNYDPAGNIWLSSLIASLPILFFFFALIKLKLKGYVAASWTVAIALAVALLFYKMPVAKLTRWPRWFMASSMVCGPSRGSLLQQCSSIRSR